MESMDTANTSEPKNSSKLRKMVLGLVLLGIITIACLGAIIYATLDQIKNNFEAISQAEPILANKPVSNQIAIVDNDGNLQLVSPEGTPITKITTDGRGYQFPTWSPDGQYLAFIGPDENDNTVLYTTSTIEASPKIIFQDPNAAPFYLYWAPDSHLITFLTQERTGLAMRQADTKAGNSRILAEGSPFYWVWSPASDKLLMHVGGSRALSDKAHLSLLANESNAEQVQLDLAPGQFQAPVWSPDGQYFYYIATNENEHEAIYRTDANTLEQAIVTNLGGFSYMVLSPTGKQIAYLQIGHTQPPFGEAYLVDTNGKNHRRITNDLIGSMFWSPDGKKLALLTVVRQEDGSTAKAGGLAARLPQEILFRWLIYHVETEKLEPLISFTPTPDFIQIIPFFDQYHLSLTFWSPDSRYLVVSKKETERSGGTIWVVDTTGEETPRQVGEGTLAVWSWQ